MIELRRLSGDALEAVLPDLARLRITVFREWPYLYDGSLAYEERYLRTYAATPGAVVIGAFDAQRLVGAATALPMAGEPDYVTGPLRAAGHAVERLFYFGESVLERAYRGQGIGVRFFAEREAAAREPGCFDHAVFCAVERDQDDPRRPVDYVPLDAFWQRRGFARIEGLRCRFSWPDVGATAESEKPMTYWIKALRVSVDVAIVGAGAAGIACALELSARGCSVLVLEAEDRLGGRAWTDRSQTVPLDRGAQYLHAVRHGNPLVDIALALGWPLRIGPFRRRPVGIDEAEVVRIYAAASAALDTAPAGASIATALADHPPLARAYAAAWLCGAEPDAVDAADFAEAVGGEDALTPLGYGALVERLAGDVPVRTGVAVEAIEVRPDRVDLATSGGRLEASRCVLTVSTGVLAAGAIRISPAPDPEIARAITDLPMGNLSKLSLVLDESALPPDRLGWFAMRGSAGPADPLLHLRPAGTPTAVVFWGGEAADALDDLTEPDALATAVDQLAAFAGESVRARVRGGLASRWRTWPHFSGSYSNARPGRHGARAVLRRRWLDRLDYAGEAVAPPGWQATVAGAWLSGRAVARRIADQAPT